MREIEENSRKEREEESAREKDREMKTEGGGEGEKNRRINRRRIKGETEEER